MNVKVKFFAHCRELAGTDLMELDLHEGATGEVLMKILEEKYPKLGELSSYVALAVNDDYVNRDKVLKDGDSISLIPPVSGG